MKEIITIKEDILISDGKSWFKRGWKIELKVTESITRIFLIFTYYTSWKDQFQVFEFLKSAHGEPKLYPASTYLIEKEKFLRRLGIKYR